MKTFKAFLKYFVSIGESHRDSGITQIKAARKA